MLRVQSAMYRYNAMCVDFFTRLQNKVTDRKESNRNLISINVFGFKIIFFACAGL